MGEAGTKMPTARVEPYHCGTDFPGWLKGEHPTVEGGEALRTVCFSDRRDPDCKKIKEISVKSCGSYFIYKLGDSPICSMRYCGTY